MTDWITRLLHEGDDRRSTEGRRGGLLRHGGRGIARELQNVLIQQLNTRNTASYCFLVRAMFEINLCPTAQSDHRVMMRPLWGSQ